MFRSLWIHKLLGLKSRRARRRQAAQTRRGVRLNLEGLEDRITPSGLPHATPGNATELLADFTFANANPNQAVTINLQAGGTYDLTDIGSSLLDQSKAGITINGNGATIKAADHNRVFEVDSGDKLVLENVTVTGGNLNTHTARGGGIADLGGFVTLSGANVTGNTVHGNRAAEGGGVYVSGGGTLTMKNGATVSNNKAIGSTSKGADGTAAGGGIYVVGGGAVSITNSTIHTNLARGGNGKAQGFEAKGGGLYLDGGSVVTITNSTFSTNNVRGGSATGTSGANGGTAQGGGIYLNGSGWKLSITGTTISGNTATGGAGAKGGLHTPGGAPADLMGGSGGPASGGGVFVSGTGSGFSILSSSFSKNTAQGGVGGPGSGNGSGGTGGTGSTGEGGGLFFKTDGSGLTITGTSFDSNQAVGGNGGLGGRGGVGASAGGNGGTGGTGGDGDGGGMWVDADGAVTITNSSVTNNKATAGIGGDGGVGGTGGKTGGTGGVGGNGGTAFGGGIDLFLAADGFTVINSTLGANTALGGNAGAGGAGGVGSNDATKGGNGSAGAAGAAFGGGLENVESSSINLINDTVAFNVAQAGTGGSNSPESEGGGINGGDAEMINVLLAGNIATDGPDYFGSVGAGSNHDFVSNTGGITNLNLLKFGVGNILDNQTMQLGPLQGPGASAGETAWYPLLANSAVINAGSLSVQADIAKAQGVPIANITDQIGNARIVNNLIDIGAIEFIAATTSMTVSNVNVTQTSSPTPVQLTATLTSQTGELINEGVVTFTVTDPGTPLGGGTVANVQVVNGVASGSFTVPGNTPPGQFTITATYTDPQNGSSGGRFGGTSGTGTLTVGATPTTPASTTVKAGNASVNISSSSQSVNVLALVNSPAGTVDEGTMTVTLFDSMGNPVGNPGSASVTGGSASVPLQVPANFPAGMYQLQESYTDGTAFGGSSDFGMLTIVNPNANNGGGTATDPPVTGTGSATATSPVTAGSVTAGAVAAGAMTAAGPANVSNASGPDAITALFTIAIDAAEFVLVSSGITSLNGTMLPPAAALMAQIQANIPFAGPLAMAAMQAGVDAGNQVASSSQ